MVVGVTTPLLGAAAGAAESVRRLAGQVEVAARAVRHERQALLATDPVTWRSPAAQAFRRRRAQVVGRAARDAVALEALAGALVEHARAVDDRVEAVRAEVARVEARVEAGVEEARDDVEAVVRRAFGALPWAAGTRP